MNKCSMCEYPVQVILVTHMKIRRSSMATLRLCMCVYLFILLHSPLHSNKQLWKVYVPIRYMFSVGAISLEDRFCSSKKGGIGGAGRVLARGAMHMKAALAGCRT